MQLLVYSFIKSLCSLIDIKKPTNIINKKMCQTIFFLFRYIYHVQKVINLSLSVAALFIYPTNGITFSIFFFFFNWHCNPCGLWPAQLSLSILSRKVFTECRCQQHVKPPMWGTSDLERSNSHHQVSPCLKRHERTPAAEGGNMGEKFPRILPKVATSTSLLGSFTCHKFRRWDRRNFFYHGS